MADRAPIVQLLAPSFACFLITGTLLAKPAGPARAQPPAGSSPHAPAPLAESLSGTAKADYNAARLLYDDGDFQGALEKLQSSYEQSKDPRLLWNMAACQKNLRHYSEVLTLVDRFLADGAGYVTESDKADAQALITTVKAFVLDLTVQASESGATVTYDEQPKGTTPLPGPLRVDMGQHTVRVSKPGFVNYVVTQDFPGGGAVTLSATLVAEVHQGTLRVIADPADVIEVDRRAVGTGLWQGVLASGSHVVFVSAKGMLSRQTEVVVSDNQTNTLHVTLQGEPKQTVVFERSKVPAWVWIAGGVVVAGAGVGAYFLFKPGDSKYATATEGNWGALSL
jgi:PEGA domain